MWHEKTFFLQNYVHWEVRFDMFICSESNQSRNVMRSPHGLYEFIYSVYLLILTLNSHLINVRKWIHHVFISLDIEIIPFM